MDMTHWGEQQGGEHGNTRHKTETWRERVRDTKREKHGGGENEQEQCLGRQTGKQNEDKTDLTGRYWRKGTKRKQWHKRGAYNTQDNLNWNTAKLKIGRNYTRKHKSHILSVASGASQVTDRSWQAKPTTALAVADANIWVWEEFSDHKTNMVVPIFNKGIRGQAQAKLLKCKVTLKVTLN